MTSSPRHNQPWVERLAATLHREYVRSGWKVGVGCPGDLSDVSWDYLEHDEKRMWLDVAREAVFRVKERDMQLEEVP